MCPLLSCSRSHMTVTMNHDMWVTSHASRSLSSTSSYWAHYMGRGSASMRWYNTVKKWLISEGFKSGLNEPCVFTHPNGLRIAVWVDVRPSGLPIRGTAVVKRQFVSKPRRASCLTLGWVNTHGSFNPDLNPSDISHFFPSCSALWTGTGKFLNWNCEL